MRPEIQGSLEERIDRIYKEAGYGTASELVRDAVRNHLNRLEAEQYSDETPHRPYFEYRILPSEEHPTEIRLFTKGESSLEVEPFEQGGRQHTVVFDTGTSYVGADEIVGRLEQVDGIDHVHVSIPDGQIQVYESTEQDPRDEAELVDEIYNTLSQLISESDRRVKQGELSRQESYQEAIRHYWDAA